MHFCYIIDKSNVFIRMCIRRIKSDINSVLQINLLIQTIIINLKIILFKGKCALLLKTLINSNNI